MISIIIPVYNTPIAYLKRCIDSVVSQTLKDWEIILVNDGSTEIDRRSIEQIVDGVPNTIVINQSNQGVSEARNTGLRYAKGTYVTFIDADDTIPSCFLQESYFFASKHNADIVIGRIQYIPSENTKQGVDTELVLKNEELIFLKKALLNIPQKVIANSVLGSPCGRLYRTEYAKNTQFHKGIAYMEDQIFNREIIECCDVAVLVPNYWYTYYQFDFSAMHSRTRQKYYEQTRQFWEIWGELNNSEKNIEIQNIMYTRCLHSFCYALRHWIIPEDENFILRYKNACELYNESYFKDAIKKLNYSDLQSIKDKVLLFLMRKRMIVVLFSLQFLKTLKGEKE